MLLPVNKAYRQEAIIEIRKSIKAGVRGFSWGVMYDRGPGKSLISDEVEGEIIYDWPFSNDKGYAFIAAIA